MKLKFSTYNRYVGFNDLPFMLVGIPILSVIVSMIFFGLTIPESIVCFTHNPISSIVATTLFWLGDRFIIGFVRRRFPSVSQDSKRLYIQGILVVVFTAVMSIALYHSEDAFVKTFGDRPHPGYLKSFVTCLFATALVAAIYETAYYISRWKESIAETEKFKREHTIAQLEALKSQVNPHFLFNSLNTLASIIPEDPDKSVEFVQKLSSVYRCILDITDRGVITLDEEIACLKNYIFLLETRFGENIKVSIQMDDDSARQKFLVPMSLQMLLENAIKHNVVSQKRPLHVRIHSRQKEVLVENNLQLKDQDTEGTGTGLLNITNRYRLIFDREIVIHKDELVFRVSLPLLDIGEYDKWMNESAKKA